LFVNTLARYIKIERPDRALVAWDSGYSAYRTFTFPEYKANRKQKYTDDIAEVFTLLHEFLYLAGFPQLQLPGYEGDDLIHAAWRACRGRRQIRIISSDKDFFQLLGNGTEQIRLTSNHEKPDRWDRNRVITELGYKPEHVVSIMALMGDKSDGIPGLPRVGPKTAIKMLRECDWDLDRLLNQLPAEQQERVLVNLALVDLSLVPLELDEPPELNLVTPKHRAWPQLRTFCEKYELNQIKTKLETNTLWE
jgi:DNA polymerase-1